MQGALGSGFGEKPEGFAVRGVDAVPPSRGRSSGSANGSETGDGGSLRRSRAGPWSYPRSLPKTRIAAGNLYPCARLGGGAEEECGIPHLSSAGRWWWRGDRTGSSQGSRAGTGMRARSWASTVFPSNSAAASAMNRWSWLSS